MSTEYKPHIGKTIIETLTMGMYEDPRFIYREYIQNAADQIDIAVEDKVLKKKDAKINVRINASKKQIQVEDNATGISRDSVLKFLGDVANSEKDQAQRKGFRGIGRLGGLGYCDKLIFTTSFKGEKIQSRMTLDAKMLRRMLKDRKNTMDASTVISVITDISQKTEAEEAHYFRVTLENVSSVILLDETNITNYLSLVAPVAFNPKFTFADSIITHFSNNNINLDEYHIEINKKTLWKRYQVSLKEEEQISNIIGIEYFEVRDNSKKLLALGWLGYRELSNYKMSPNIIERGIRLRKNNIQIGNENTLSKFFKAERTNLRFIGELHVIGSGFIPNARRDYFNDNTTCQIFEKKLKEALDKGNYENLIAQNASKIQNKVESVISYNVEKEEFDKKVGNFRSAAEENMYKVKLAESRAKALKAEKELITIKNKGTEDKKVKILYETLTKNKNLKLIEGVAEVKSKYNPPRFTKLTPSETKLVREIFVIIENVLKFDDSEKLKGEILRKYN